MRLRRMFKRFSLVGRVATDFTVNDSSNLIQQQDLDYKGQAPKIALISAHYSATGHKPTQEDRVCVSSDPITLEHRDEQLNGIRVGFYAVLDGHGGHFSAEFLSTNLTECLREAYGELPVDEGALDEAALRALLTRTCELAEVKLAAEKRMKVTIKPPRFVLLSRSLSESCWLNAVAASCGLSCVFSGRLFFGLS